MTAAKRTEWVGRLLGPKWLRPSVPDGTRVYAVGDIHGRHDLLEKLLTKIRADAIAAPRDNILIFLGDYVDRGPQSKDVIEQLRYLAWPGWDVVALRGNHEQMVLEFCAKPDVYKAWRDFGGTETLTSYGVKPPSIDDPAEYQRARSEFVQNIPAEHLSFLRSLPYCCVVGDYMFVHAGVRPDIPLDRQSPEDMLWIRDEFLLSERVLDKFVVHGHTPVERPVVKANRMDVDTGAYASGNLTAVVLEDENSRFLTTGAI